MNRRNFIKNTLIAAAVAAGGSILGKTAKSALLRENKKMKILVLTGSPRPNGNSNTLADNFIKGAEAAGHKVFRFDAAFKQVHPCIACNSCGMNGPCVSKTILNLSAPTSSMPIWLSLPHRCITSDFPPSLKALLTVSTPLTAKSIAPKKRLC